MSVIEHSGNMNEFPDHVPKLEFSEKYTDAHAHNYFRKHTSGPWQRLSNWREIGIARQALRTAGDPRSILDLPSGTGRFWSMLAEDKTRKLYAADYNESMLGIALTERPRSIVQRFETFQASAFDIPRADGFVECIFCMRLLHHIGRREHRMKLLREFHRVSSATVVISLWVDGNYRSRKRARLEHRRKGRSYQNRFVLTREAAESEMSEAGFRIIGHHDLLKYYAMWRIYALRKM